VPSIVILGAGELGGALARQLAAADIVPRIVLIDDAGRIAEGKALDIQQASPVEGYSTTLSGTRDEAAIIGADAVVIADRAEPGHEWQGDRGVALIQRIAYVNGNGMILCAGAQQLELIQRAVREVGVPRQRVLGSAPEALRAAVISMVALEAGCSPTEVSLAVFGRPPHQLIVPWEDAAIGGRAATAVLPPPAITRLDSRLAQLWPPGPFTLASAATRLLKAAAARARLSVCAFVVPEERGNAGILPVLARPYGIAQIVRPTLNTRDRVRLETAFQ
jgi:malate dehydrogenase